MFAAVETSDRHKHRVCPWWVGYLLLSPLRRLGQNPARILAPHVRHGMTVLEVGPAMGYFSLPLARMVGPEGRVVCVDVQRRMLDRLERRARRAGLADRIETVHAAEDSLRIGAWDGRVDFTLAFAVVHEVPDQDRLMAEIHRAMKPGAAMLLGEPRGHVAGEDFDASVRIAGAEGFAIESPVAIARSRSVVLRRSPSAAA